MNLGMQPSMKVIVVCKQQLLRDSLCDIIYQLHTAVEIVKAQDLMAAFRTAADHNDVRLLLAYTDLKDDSIHPSIMAFRLLYPQCSLVLLTDDHTPQQEQQALRAGVHRVIPLTSSKAEILQVLLATLASRQTIKSDLPADDHTDLLTKAELAERVRQARKRLTPRQRQVLNLLRDGKSNKEIAQHLDMAEGTVKMHCMSIFRELGVTNRTQAALYADPPRRQTAARQLAFQPHMLSS